MFTKRSLLLCLLLGAITLALYWTTTSFDFINWDDNDYVTQNAHVLRGLNWKDVKWAFSTSYSSNWHPLTWISHMLDCQIYGLKPGGHHFTNILFHTFNAMLLFIVLLRLTNAVWPSWLVAALFAWHPAHIQSVAWIAERKDVLSTFFGLLAMLAYIGYVNRLKTKNGRSKWYYCLALVCYALSLMSKPMLVTLPFVLLLLDWWPLGRSAECGVRSAELKEEGKDALGPSNFGRLVLEKIPFLLLAIGCCFLTIWAQERAKAFFALASFPMHVRIENAMLAYAKYIEMMVWPTKLSIFYMLVLAPAPFVQAALAFLLLCAITVGVLRCLRDKPFFAVGWLWFLGTLVPVIGLVQVGGQDMADRYTYFPYIGLFIAVVWGAAKIWEKNQAYRTALVGAAVVALAGCVMATTVQLRYWQNSFTIFERAASLEPYNYVAYTKLADASEKAGKYDDAMAYLNTALRFSTTYPQTLFVLGEVEMHQGKLVEACENLKKAVELQPSAAEIHQKLAIDYVLQGKMNEASNEFSIVTHQALDPFSECKLGIICSQMNDMTSAAKHYEATLALQPQNVEALNNLAWIRAASQKPELRNGKEAVELARRACQLTQRNEPFMLGTLAAAYAEAGQFTEAVATGTQAHDLALARNDKNLAQRNEELIKLYKSGQAYHEPTAKTVEKSSSPAAPSNASQTSAAAGQKAN